MRKAGFVDGILRNQNYNTAMSSFLNGTVHSNFFEFFNECEDFKSRVEVLEKSKRVVDSPTPMVNRRLSVDNYRVRRFEKMRMRYCEENSSWYLAGIPVGVVQKINEQK